MKHHATELLTMISDHGNVVAAKFVNGLGAVSVGSGATLGAVAVSVNTEPSFWQSSLPVVAGVVSVIGGLTFIAKNIFDMWLSAKKERREEEAAKIKGGK